MNYKVVIRPEAEKDIQEAFLWYENKRNGLGHDFLLQVDAGMQFLGRNPEVHPIAYRGTRIHLTKRFPYKIIYLVEPQRVVVLAVAHGKRSSRVIEKRVTGS